MKKFLCLFLTSSFLSSALFAENPSPSQEALVAAENLPTNLPEETILSAKPKEVGKASEESRKAARRRDWQNWLFASTSVAMAIVALVLLSDSGHAPHHHHHD